MRLSRGIAHSERIRAEVRRYYASRVTGGVCNCDDMDSSCCATSAAQQHAEHIGYSARDLAQDYTEANLGLGCGNPIALGALRPGERVLDLGSGAGFDCLLAAGRVGKKGTVVGVDMTAEMVGKARGIAARRRIRNVEFRLGEIEHLPVADGSFDVIISNCVINLSPDKEQVFREAYRALVSGGRLAIADIMEIEPMPEELRSDPQAYCSCVSGAINEQQMRVLLEGVGFIDVTLERLARGGAGPEGKAPGPDHYVAAVFIHARKG